MRIVTTLTHTDKGSPRIVAKGFGKQKTIPYDHGVSHDRNHGYAAGELILAHSSPYADDPMHDLARSAVRSIDAGYSTHEVVSGSRHVFNV